MGGRTNKGSNQQARQMQMQVNAPPPWAAGLYAQAGSDAQELYRRGMGGNVYQGQRVAPLSNQTRQAISGLADTATGFNNENLARLIQTPTSSERNLTNLAHSGRVGNNGAFDAALQHALDNTATMVNSRMSGAGRVGSGAHTQSLASALGNIATAARTNQYNHDVDAMLKANAQIDQANQNQLSTVGNFLTRQSDGYRGALAGGQIQDNQAQDRLDAERQRWLENDNREWERLGQLLAAANGVAGDYGSRAVQSQNSSRKDPGLTQTLASLGRLAGKR